MESTTASLNFAFKLPTSIFTTGNARTRKSTAPPRILEINCLCPHQACLMLRHHPPALPNRDPLTRSRNLGPLHHLPHRPSPRNKTFLRFSAQMESSVRRKGSPKATRSVHYMRVERPMSDKCSSGKENAQGQPVNLEPVPENSGTRPTLPKLSLWIHQLGTVNSLTHQWPIVRPTRSYRRLSRKSVSAPPRSRPPAPYLFFYEPKIKKQSTH